jgi:hypothetical protein
MSILPDLANWRSIDEAQLRECIAGIQPPIQQLDKPPPPGRFQAGWNQRSRCFAAARPGSKAVLQRERIAKDESGARTRSISAAIESTTSSTARRGERSARRTGAIGGGWQPCPAGHVGVLGVGKRYFLFRDDSLETLDLRLDSTRALDMTVAGPDGQICAIGGGLSWWDPSHSRL